MLKFAKITLVAGVLATLTACTGHIENTKNNCSYDYFLHQQFRFQKLLVAVARLRISNRSDCADTKKPGSSRFLHL